MKNRTALFALICLLGAFAPAVATAWQAEPEHRAPRRGAPPPPVTNQGATAGRAGIPRRREHAAEHEEAGEHHGPKAINWWDFSNKEQPPYGVMLANFAILMTMYYALGKKPIAEGLKSRRANVAKEIEDAQLMRHEAEERALKYQEKLKHLEVELTETREALRGAGEAERQRIVKEAEEKAARMERDAKFLVEQELKQHARRAHAQRDRDGHHGGRGASEEANHPGGSGAPRGGLPGRAGGQAPAAARTKRDPPREVSDDRGRRRT